MESVTERWRNHGFDANANGALTFGNNYYSTSTLGGR
jgi:hypothetical protein